MNISDKNDKSRLQKHWNLNYENKTQTRYIKYWS